MTGSGEKTQEIYFFGILGVLEEELKMMDGKFSLYII
jgi:hypothetical protein